MNDGTFTKIEKSDQRLYGPPAVLVCGYPVDEHPLLLDALERLGLGDRPVIFAGTADAGRTLQALLQFEDRAGLRQSSEMPRAIVMSGFTQTEVHKLMTAYRQGGMPPQLWATLTPTSEGWSLADLLAELAAESEVFRQRQAQKPKSTET